jgi:zinc resistance-associated protein
MERAMFKKLPIGLVAASMVLSSAALAQQTTPSTDGVRHERGAGEHKHRGERLSPEDRAAFSDARIAALHAGLRLNADQEKNWPPVESALRDLAKERAAAVAERKESNERLDPIQRLRNTSDAMTSRGAALKRLADATEPLYRSLDDAQKRRLEILSRQVMQPHGMGRRGRHR